MTDNAMTEGGAINVLSDEELDRLENLLDDPDLPEAMRLDEVQGYLCAALSGPRPLNEAAWLADILGSEAVLETPAGQEAAALLRAFAGTIEAGLAAGEPPILYLYGNEEDGSGPSDYQPWCQAYLAGVDAAEEDWFEYLGDEEEDIDEESSDEIDYLDERLFPLMVLTGEAEAAAREHGEEWPDGEARSELISDSEEDLPQAVTDIFRFWQAKRGAVTLRRNEAKVGRNDPCTCGSGKKYKHCCGAA